jgi:hypothetical protein
MTAPFSPADGEVVPAPTVNFTVAEFLDWARTKPADEGYGYMDACKCACGQFADFAGIDWRARCSAAEKARWDFEAKYEHQLRDHPRTFGALAKRLETIAYRGRVG